MNTVCSTAGIDFFSESFTEIEAAKAVCGDCPLMADCLTGAVRRAEGWGVWGGQLFDRGRPVANRRTTGRPRKERIPVGGDHISVVRKNAAEIDAKTIRELHADGMTRQEIKLRTGFSDTKVRAALPPSGRTQITDEDRAAAIELLSQGMAPSAIASIIEASERTVYRLRDRMLAEVA